MRLAAAFNRLIAVESHPVRRAQPAPADPPPAAGARWGRPGVASDDFASRNRASEKPAQLAYRFVDRSRVFRGDESHRQFLGRNVSVGGATLTPGAVRSTTFYLGTRVEKYERRHVGRGGAVNVTPVIETIHDYIDIKLPFGDATGERGEPHPPATPLREAPDYGG